MVVVLKMAGKKRGWYTSVQTHSRRFRELGKLTAESIGAAIARAKCFATIQEASEALFGVLRIVFPCTQLALFPDSPTAHFFGGL